MTPAARLSAAIAILDAVRLTLDGTPLPVAVA